jgi:hypothetical protein
MPRGQLDAALAAELARSTLGCFDSAGQVACAVVF